VKRELMAADGVTWSLSARETFSSVGQSADLWLTPVRPDGLAEAPVYLGASPSCHGRALWRTNADGKTRTSLCYLSLYALKNAAVEVRMHLGGGWKHTLTLPLDAARKDSDGDKWSDALEGLVGTDAHNPDTDGDGMKDSEDPNPTVTPASPPVATQREQDVRELTALSAADLPGCLPGKPLVLIVPDEALQSLPPRPCPQIMLTRMHPVARWRSVLLPVDGRIPRMSAHTLDEAARAGGIARALVQIKSLATNAATVDVVMLTGTIRRQLERRAGQWVSVGSSFLPADGVVQ